MTEPVQVEPVVELAEVKPKRPSHLFQKGDSRINRGGRIPDEERLKKLTKKQLKDRELIMMLRKIKPHIADAIMRAATIMDDKNAVHANQLKASMILLDNYRKLILDIYGTEVDPGDAGEEIQQENRPIFSLSVVEDKDT